MRNVRRLRAGLRGWGGVGAMAALCALALVFALVLTRAGSSAGPGKEPRTAGPGVTDALGAKAAEECDDPEKQTLTPSDADGPVIDAIKARPGERRKLVVGIDQNSYGWGYRDPNSGDSARLEGFDIDLAHRIAEDVLGDRDAVQFKAIPTDQRIPAIQDGRVDMIVRTMTINCERLEDVAFSAPYFTTGQQVLAPKTSPVKGYGPTLADREICTAAGSTAYANLEADKARGALPGRSTSAPPSPTSSTAWCGCSSARSTRSSPTPRSPPARPRRTRRSNSRATPSRPSTTAWP